MTAVQLFCLLGMGIRVAPIPPHIGGGGHGWPSLIVLIITAVLTLWLFVNLILIMVNEYKADKAEKKNRKNGP